MALISILFLGIVVAAFSLGLAFIFDTQATGMRWQRRALFAALGGAFLPMPLPLFVVLIEEGISTEFWLIFGSLIFAGLFLAAVIGFPIAYWFCRRRERVRNPPNPEQVFD